MAELGRVEVLDVIVSRHAMQTYIHLLFLGAN